MATNLKKHGQLREFEKLSESQGNLIFLRKTCKTQGKCKICGIIANKNVSHQIFSLELLRETMENSLREFSLSKLWPPRIEMGSLPVPPTEENPAPLGFFLYFVKTV